MVTCIKTTKAELKGNSNLIQKRLYRSLTKGEKCSVNHSTKNDVFH